MLAPDGTVLSNADANFRVLVPAPGTAGIALLGLGALTRRRRAAR
jgi:uncharacterized protein (TIGR03382 family)